MNVHIDNNANAWAIYAANTCTKRMAMRLLSIKSFDLGVGEHSILMCHKSSLYVITVEIHCRPLPSQHGGYMSFGSITVRGTDLLGWVAKNQHNKYFIFYRCNVIPSSFENIFGPFQDIKTARAAMVVLFAPLGVRLYGKWRAGKLTAIDKAINPVIYKQIQNMC